MDDLGFLDELVRLLDTDDAETAKTASAADALRLSLETLAMETALHLHYGARPDSQPSLAEIARALAVQDGSPLAERPDLIAAAASAGVARRPDADADDVLLWAEAQLSSSGM